MSTDTIVFLGPSLNQAEAKLILPHALYLAPVQCGDVLKVLRLKPKLIAIIDGFFENTAAVWHKEILYALEQGVRVYGAASMGALRASELHSFGMLGVGEIYQDFLTGKITDDDEVCVLHRPAASNYEPITDAMVNIRATIKQALNDNVIDAATATFILNISKTQNYKERSLKTALEIAKQQGFSEQITENFKTWLAKVGIINQKYQDAKRLLQDLTALNISKPVASTKPRVNHSLYLRTLQLDIMCRPFAEENVALPLAERVALHARLLGKEYILNRHLAYLLAAKQAIVTQNKNLTAAAVNKECYVQYMSIWLDLDKNEIADPRIQFILSLVADLWACLDLYIEHLDIKITSEALQIFVDKFRREHQLSTADSTYAWMKEQQLDGPQFEKMLISFCHLDFFVLKNNFDQLGTFINSERWWFLDALKLTGTFERAAQLVNNKEKCNEAMSLLKQQSKTPFDEYLYELDFAT